VNSSASVVAERSACVSFLLPRHPLFDGRVSRPAIRTAGKSLLRVELDDQLLGSGTSILGALGQLGAPGCAGARDHLQPARDRRVACGSRRATSNGSVFSDLSLDVDDVVLPTPCSWGWSTLTPLTVKWPWLTSWRHPAGAGKARAVDHVVQPALQDAQQVSPVLPRPVASS